MEGVTNFIFLSSKITVDSDCSHEIKIRLLLGRKAMTKPRQHIKKQRYHFANKGLYSQSYGFFPLDMYRCESQPIKKAEYQRIDVCEYSAGEDF